MLYDELWILDASKFINIELERELHHTAIGGPRLVKRYGINDIAAIGRADAKLQVIFPNRALLDN